LQSEKEIANFLFYSRPKCLKKLRIFFLFQAKMSLKVGERDIIISFKLDNFLELTWKNQVRCLVCYKDFSKRSNAKRHVAACVSLIY